MVEGEDGALIGDSLETEPNEDEAPLPSVEETGKAVVSGLKVDVDVVTTDVVVVGVVVDEVAATVAGVAARSKSQGGRALGVVRACLTGWQE